MQELEQNQDAEALSPEEFVAGVTQSENLAAEIADAQLSLISEQVLADYKIDKTSMDDWFQRMERGLDLAKLVKEDKNYPFDGAANIKYPLITSAALQFNARSYPAIVAPDRVVKTKVWGDDPSGVKAGRADRISEHMSWQLSAKITEWEEDTDKLLVQLPIVGTMVRKWWFDPVAERPRCRLTTPGKFIVNDKVKTLDDAPRCTEELDLYPNEVEERKRAGLFVENFEIDTTGEDKQALETFVEQHTRLDLDEDGYAEPYVVTVHVETQKVVRIVADFDESDVHYQTETQQSYAEQQVVDPATGIASVVAVPQEEEIATGILAIRRGTYFVAHHFLPSMDGGFWGTGLGILLGDISDSINSIINMLLDAGHYGSLGGGFIGSEFRLKGGSNRMKPGEWKTVASNGADIKSAIVPLTYPGPDATLFQMLGLLIDAGREIASVKDVVTGEAPRQQQTATTTLALIEQGMMVFTAAYKRIFRACKGEYALLAKINQGTVSKEEYTAFHDMRDQEGNPVELDPSIEYDGSDMDVQPVADPQNVTKMQQAGKAQLIMQMAEQGLYDRNAAAQRISEAMDIEDVEELLPQPDPMQEQMAQMQMQAAHADLTEKMVNIELTLAKVEETRSQAIENMANAEGEQIRSINEATKTRLDGLRTMLDDERQRMGILLREFGGMARKPRDGNAPISPAEANGQAQGSIEGQMVIGAGGGGNGPQSPLVN